MVVVEIAVAGSDSNTFAAEYTETTAYEVRFWWDVWCAICYFAVSIIHTEGGRGGVRAGDWVSLSSNSSNNTCYLRRTYPSSSSSTSSLTRSHNKKLFSSLLSFLSPLRTYYLSRSPLPLPPTVTSQFSLRNFVLPQSVYSVALSPSHRLLEKRNTNQPINILRLFNQSNHPRTYLLSRNRWKIFRFLLLFLFLSYTYTLSPKRLLHSPISD